MKIMVNALRFLSIVGIYNPTRKRLSARQIFLRIIYFSYSIYLAVAQISYAFLQQNATIIDRVFAFYVSNVTIGLAIQVLIMIHNQQKISDFVSEMEQFINKRIQLTNSEIFGQNEVTLSKVATFFFQIGCLSLMVFVVTPAANIGIAYGRNTITEDIFQAPFKDLYFFWDSTKTPTFQICYAVFAIGLTFVLFAYVMVDTLFFSISLWLKAMYDDLKHAIQRLDQLTADGRSRGIVDCIKLHIQVLRFIKYAKEILNAVLLTQFVYSLSAIACSIFAGSTGSLVNCLSIIPSVLCMVSELFLFCWTGSMVLDEAYYVNLTVYTIRWYEFTVQERKLLLFMMMRTQYPNGLGAFNYIMCNNETFFTIMSNVFSAMTFLQNMV